MDGDSRFNVPRLLLPEELATNLAQHHVVVVPSIWLETGPLVVMEAFSLGLPVVGSRLGGIAEKVRDGVDGLLFEPGDEQALAAILRELIMNEDALNVLVRNVTPPRTFSDVAGDMTKIYSELCRLPACQSMH
jgi:glycosyltransferase involved in cell wall biosynthesis